MSAIDQVVARSRLGGGFAGERKTFTLARKRAIRKMREFALADPYYFVLELIQAAVAQGASYINLTTDDDDFTLSYAGACFHEEELGQLFDFLFAGKDRTDIGHVRELALGINALLLFKPARIVVESGDGTLPGTTRLEISRGAEQVEVGRAAAPLKGTFLRAEKMQRHALRHKTALMPLPGLPLEAAAIEERCLTSPIPVVVNSTPLFGYSVARVPRLLGYNRTITFDEGDLYGALGVGAQSFQASFKLLTYGVWIESLSHPLLPGGPEVGGIICFDHLHKTADHSGIVKDHRWDEMWARLRPYAERLAHGETGVIHGSVTLLDGSVLGARELRPVLRAAERVCLVGANVTPSTRTGQLAATIGEVLGSLVLRVDEGHRSWLRGLAGPDVSFLTPDLSGDADLPFYTAAPPLAPPARPWLASEVALATLPLEKLADDVERRLGLAVRPTELLLVRDPGEVSATVYTPAAPPAPEALTVQLYTVDRLAYEVTLQSPYPGHVLQARLPDLPPRLLQARVGRGEAARRVGTLLAWELSQRAAPALAAASRRALLRVGATEDTSAVGRAMTLAALQRTLVLRLISGADGPPRLALSLVGDDVPEDLLDRPLFPTLGGGWASLRRVADLLEAQHGLIYGVLPQVPPALEGLDAREILQLEPALERQLLALVGDAAYVRVDRREVLAAQGDVACRDLALGLRPYPDFPLLVEGADPTAWSAAQRHALVEALVTQLAARFAGVTPPCPATADAQAAWEEDRRQACRHLQWFVCRRAAAEPAGAALPHLGVEDLPLFLDPEGRAWSFAQVRLALARPEGLAVSLRKALGGSELGALTAAAQGATGDGGSAQGPAPEALAVSPFVGALLAPLGGVRFALDHPLPHEAGAAVAAGHPPPPGASGAASPPLGSVAGGEPRYLRRVEVKGEGFAGVVGIPADPDAAPEIVVLEPATGRLHALPEVAWRYGMVGLVRLGAGTLADRGTAPLVAALGAAGKQLLTDLLAHLPTLAPGGPAHLSAALRLLAFAGEHLQLMATPEGVITGHTPQPLASQVLELPLFPGAGGVLLSGRLLLERFCSRGGAGLAEASLTPEAPPALARWIRYHLQEARVIRPASHTSSPLAPGLDHADVAEDAPLAEAVERWLEALRPDRYGLDPQGFTPPGGPPTARLPFRVVIRSAPVFARYARPELLLTYTYFERIPTLVLNGGHWLVGHARAQAATDPTALAALLLGCYAHVNAALDPVTNEHERLFQLGLIEALEAGTLTVAATPGPGPAGPSTP